MHNVLSSTPERAVDLIRGLNEIYCRPDPTPGDMRDEESRADLMFTAGQREVVDNLMRVYGLMEENDGVSDTRYPRS